MNINSILWYLKLNADISILHKSVFLGLPFCGLCRVQCANLRLTYWPPYRIKAINWLWKPFSLLSMENARFYRFLLFTPGARSNFWGVVRVRGQGWGDNSIQFINIGRVGDKRFKELTTKSRGVEGWVTTVF